MSKRIATIQDDNGDVWTGAVEEKKGPDIVDLAIGIVCPPYLVGALCSSDTSTTVTMNGESHSGRKI